MRLRGVEAELQAGKSIVEPVRRNPLILLVLVGNQWKPM